MTNSDSIYQLICELYDKYKKNPNITVLCVIETSKNNYFGTLVFDENLVVFDESLKLKDVCISQNMFSEVTMYEKACFAFNSIAAFSYKIVDNKVVK